MHATRHVVRHVDRPHRVGFAPVFPAEASGTWLVHALVMQRETDRDHRPRPRDALKHRSGRKLDLRPPRVHAIYPVSDAIAAPRPAFVAQLLLHFLVHVVFVGYFV